MQIQDLDDLDDDGEIDHPLPRDLMFDPWLTLSGPLSESSGPILREVFSALFPQGRKPRADLVAGIAAIIPAIIANLLKLRRERPEGSRLVMQMEHRKKSRYDRRGFRKLPEVVLALQEAGYVLRREAVYKMARTTIEAGDRLKPLLAAPHVSLSHIGRAEGEETILLTARPTVRRIAGRKQPKLLVDYEDTEESLRLRTEMEEINRFLSVHAIELEGSPQPAFRLHRIFTLRDPGDPVRFSLHGRLYGGFWMALKASERHRLRIDGQEIADLDFTSMFPRLAYGHVGKEPPSGDLYAVPGLEACRDGAKAALSALLSYGSEMRSLPPRLKSQLPDGWTASRVRQAFAARHPDLAPLFGRDFGLDLMFAESRILLATLCRLMDRDIPALPMHDGIMVPRSGSGQAASAMRETSREIVGFPLQVTLKA